MIVKNGIQNDHRFHRFEQDGIGLTLVGSLYTHCFYQVNRIERVNMNFLFLILLVSPVRVRVPVPVRFSLLSLFSLLER